MTKRQALTYLLDHEDDLLNLHGNGTGRGAGYRGEGTPILSHAPGCPIVRCTCWQASLAELDRSVRRLRLVAPFQHGHLVGRYRAAERVRASLRWQNGWQRKPWERVLISPFGSELEEQRYRGKTPPHGTYDVLLLRWKPWVDLLVVAQALDRLEQLYEGEPVRAVEEALAA